MDSASDMANTMSDAAANMAHAVAPHMTVDLTMLVYAAVLCILLAIPYTMSRVAVRGFANVAGYPKGPQKPIPDWAERAIRAHMNLVENLPSFAVLVLAANVAGLANAQTALGAQVFFWARVAHAIVHIAGIPYVRTLAYGVAVAGNVIILLQLI